jgi:hypothetical protein
MRSGKLCYNIGKEGRKVTHEDRDWENRHTIGLQAVL